MPRELTLLISGFVFIFFTACATTTKQAPPPPQARSEHSLSQYTIGVGDELMISVWKKPEVSLTVPVRPDGKISVPLIGDVLSAGIEPEDLAETIASRLKTYIRSPKVTVVVIQASSNDFVNRVRITGAVESATSLPYRKGMTVLDLTLLAGSVNDFASPNKAKLYRLVDGEYQVFSVFLTDILSKGKLSTNYALSPSDVIIVPERSF